MLKTVNTTIIIPPEIRPADVKLFLPIVNAQYRQKKTYEQLQTYSKTKQPAQGYIYICRSKDKGSSTYKIGLSSDPRSRVKKFPNLEVVSLIPTNHMNMAEHMIHDGLADFRVKNERECFNVPYLEPS